MRRLTRAVAGAGALSVAFVGGLAAAGGFSGEPDPSTVTKERVKTVSVTGPDALKSFDDCDALLDWYVEKNLTDVTAYGWKQQFSGYFLGDMRRAPLALNSIDRLSVSLAKSANAGRTSSETGTNTQEVGVDEPDTAKTDGKLVVHVNPSAQRVVITDVTGAKPRRVSSVRLGAEMGQPELLLVGKRLLVVSAGYQDVHWGRGIGGPSYGGSRIMDVDLTDPAAPRVVETHEYDGQIESVRQYGGVVRVVVGKQRPELPWTAPGAGISKEQATARNRELVRESALADWLPAVRELRGGDTSRVPCADVHGPPIEAGTGTTAVFTWTGSSVTSLALAADPGVVYSSPDRLYVATSQTSGDRGDWGRRPTTLLKSTTYLHSFALDGNNTAYVASGHVDGLLRDRWSLDERDGRLRVAFARTGKRGGTRDNGVAVFTEKDGKLSPSGAVTGLGVREEIQSVRWYDDFAVVVTFRQVDPLYTISFKDPSQPRLLGKLKIPGFSSYLHPIGGDLVLGIGQDADPSGRTTGAQVALFDLSALERPRQVAKKRFYAGSEMMAGWDPRAFTWLPGATGKGRAYTLVQGWDVQPLLLRKDMVAPPTHDGVGVALLEVDGAHLRARMLPTRAQPHSRIMAIDGGRVVLVGEGVRLLP